MIEAAKAVTKQWAQRFIDRHGVVRDTSHFRELIDLTRKDGQQLDRVMCELQFDLFVAVVVHHTSKQIAAQKVREVSILASEAVTRREYWNKLDRAHHFVAGVLALQHQTEGSGN